MHIHNCHGCTCAHGLKGHYFPILNHAFLPFPLCPPGEPRVREFLDYFSGGLNEVALGKGELFKDDVAFPADATSLFTRLDHTPIAATPASAVRHSPVAFFSKWWWKGDRKSVV